MSDPTLKRTKVVISYTGSDGYRSEMTLKGGTGSHHLVTGAEVPPQAALLAAVDELARITALFGFADEAMAEFTAAHLRVAQWRASRKLKTTGENS